MSVLRTITLSSRTASLLLTPPGALYRLAAPVAWSLWTSDNQIVAEGIADVAPLFVEGLTPSTAYVLKTDLGDLPFQTEECGGLVLANDHGASPEADDNTQALTHAIAATPEGGTLTLHPGRYLTGPLFLKPDMVLYLPDGVELHALSDRASFPILPCRDDAGRVIGTWEGLPEASFAALITAIDCDGLKITGRGILDGGGDRGDWWSWPKETRDGARRPRTLFLAYSADVALSGITVRNSPSWTIHPMKCDRLVATALFIENPPNSPNTDGLDPESCLDVVLSGLHFSVGDDCIAVKSGKRAPGRTDHLVPTRRLSITHSHMERGHGAVVLGSEMSGSITDVTISDCSFERTDRGLRIKTRRGRGGCVARVVMERVEMTSVPTPFAANAHYFCDEDGHSTHVQSRFPAPVDDTTPTVRDITVQDVTARDVQIAAAALLGLPEAPITGITLSNFRVSYDPAATAEIPLMADHVAAVRHGGIIATQAQVNGDVDDFVETRNSLPC